MNTKTTVIFHSADYDGIFCREIARKFLPEAELIGWNFGDPPLVIPAEGEIYVLDIPVDRPFGFAFAHKEEHFEWLSRVVWIDHHKSSIETHPTTIPGYRIDGVAACRLAWFYFTALERYREQTKTADFTWFQGHYPWATKQDFVERKVTEPLAVRLAGEYDIWDKRDPNAETFQYALRAADPERLSEAWGELLGNTSQDVVHYLLAGGRAAQRYAQQQDAANVTHNSFIVEWESLKFVALNTGPFNSLTFAAKDVPETGHDALLGFRWTGKHWMVSLYHAKHRTDLDLSEIAKRHHGGGHRGACGFTCDKLPFHPFYRP
jgi:hypothetical protein